MKQSDVVKHFQVEGISRTTIYRIIKRYKSGVPCEDKPRKGRPPKLNQNQRQKLKESVENRVGVSQRKLALKFKVPKTCIQENLKKMGLKHYRRQRAPKYTQQQREKLSSKCRKLRREIIDSETFIIIDDEKYFTFPGAEMPGNAGFYSSDKEKTPPDVKYKSKQKFEPKILVWLTLSSKGISTPYIGRTKGPAVDANVYICKCLPKLIKFINKYHINDKYIFWPDLASSHYANKTTDWLNERKVPFVPKDVNPPNVPKARPIEDFWGVLAQQVYNGGWIAMNREQLINRIKRQLKKIDLKVVQTMMKDVRGKLRKIEDKGPFSIL
ncbi:unnamed protein product [Rotaria magnacalcarata]|uniref:Transposase Synechocystis PCC 6803 domain-containing protein n=3 Tax=Rotaria magnacalcarata TaxID=392030 RepID=A0A814ZRI8_9BILA|nr:unnamed protein product [Rotaria magnacalcarata]CAF1247186.1 unnamed protein product [Rotaria magnacalcarata]CAF2038232.1 unnamed protein product [Rotaria magnacalcarata]CAF2082473.1 unnamed protein product [Rotaria magnacalcarata]CAF2117544.1 unnamed protein product [Rotaria magnacalcarata]